MKESMMLKKMISVSAAAVLLAGCEKSAESFSILSTSSSFKQSVGYVQRKIDILWVVDNSGSMSTSQQNLANNFQSFISRFSQLGYDFQMGVTSTDAYLAYHYNDPSRSRLKDGGSVHSGIRIMDTNTPNLSNVFLTNVKLGINGNGDERAFSSFENTLGNSLNAGFKRPGSFLAIIVVSDEDDFSHYDWANGVNSYVFDENYANQFPLSRFTTYLDTLTQTQAGSGVQNYSVSTISVLDQACANSLSTDGFARKIGTRYMQMADLTNGSKGSLCGDFGSTLQMISNQVVELSSVFKLDREPVPSTIVVTVDGVSVPQSATNGWTYDATTWTISFHGSAIPAGGSDVRINYDPKSVKL